MVPLTAHGSSRWHQASKRVPRDNEAHVFEFVSRERADSNSLQTGRDAERSAMGKLSARISSTLCTSGTRRHVFSRCGAAPANTCKRLSCQSNMLPPSSAMPCKDMNEKQKTAKTAPESCGKDISSVRLQYEPSPWQMCGSALSARSGGPAPSESLLKGFCRIFSGAYIRGLLGSIGCLA